MPIAPTTSTACHSATPSPGHDQRSFTSCIHGEPSGANTRVTPSLQGTMNLLPAGSIRTLSGRPATGNSPRGRPSGPNRRSTPSQATVAQAAPARTDIARSTASAAGNSTATRISAAEPASRVREEVLNTYFIEYASHRSAQGIGGPLGYARYAAHNADMPSAQPR